MSSAETDCDLVGLNDILKAIWSLDPWLNSQIPATSEDKTNRFYEDGLGYITSPEDLPPQFATLNDDGTVVRTKASGRAIEYKSSYNMLIGTPSKALTRQLSVVFTGHIERVLRGQVCNLGTVGAYVIDPQRTTKAESGLRLWSGQLTATIQGRIPWQLPLAAHVL